MANQLGSQTDIVFSLADLLRETPVTPKFPDAPFRSDTRDNSAVPRGADNGNYGYRNPGQVSRPPSSASSVYSVHKSLSSAHLDDKVPSNGSIVRRQVEIPPARRYLETPIQPLRLPDNTRKGRFHRRFSIKSAKSAFSLSSSNGSPDISPSEPVRHPSRPRQASTSSTRLSNAPPNPSNSSPIVLSGSPPGPVDASLQNPTQSSAELKPKPKTPPAVTPYIDCMRQATTGRRNRSLVGSSCCFCEEPLEFLLAEERVLVLKCQDVAHYHCLSQLTDMEAVRHNVPGSGLPVCPNCNEVAHPGDDSIYHEIMKEKLLRSPTSDSYSQLISNLSAEPNLHRTDDSSSAESLSAVPRTPPELVVDESNSPESMLTRSITSSSSHSCRRKRAARPIQLTSPPRQVLFTDSLKKQNYSNGADIANAQCLLPKLEVSAVAEMGEITPLSSEDRFCTFLVSVSSPPRAGSHYQLTDRDIERRKNVVSRLQHKVKDWQSLRPAAFGDLRLWNNFRMSRDAESWQDITCYLFEEVLVIVKEYNQAGRAKESYVKAAIYVSNIGSVSCPERGTLKLEIANEMPRTLYLDSLNGTAINDWFEAFSNSNAHFPITLVQDPQIPRPLFNGAEEDSKSVYSLGSSNCFPAKHVSSKNTPIDIVVAIQQGEALQNAKFDAIRESILTILRNMGPLDKLGIVMYGGSTPQLWDLEYARSSDWKQVISQLQTGLAAPSTDGDGECDLDRVLAACREAISNRQSANPHTVFYVLSDSKLKSTNSNCAAVLDHLDHDGICVHTYGITLRHDVDSLYRAANRTGGTYTYVREWNELIMCVEGRIRTDRAITYRNVELVLRPKNGAAITSVDSSASATRPGTREPVLRLGSLARGQAKSTLVQTSIPPKSVIKRYLPKNGTALIDFFDVTISYRGFHPGDGSVQGAPCAKGMVQVKDSSDMFEPPLTPLGAPKGPGMASSAHPPSPIFGDVVYADGDGNDSSLNIPLFLAVKERRPEVVHRKVELAGARAFNAVVDRMAHKDVAGAHRIISQTRLLLKGTISTMADDAMSGQVKKLGKMLDAELWTLSDKVTKVTVFESDTKKSILQLIGILQGQTCVTRRTWFEQLHYRDLYA
uniref:ARAD1A10494p n=1 Tax=Blastobotrys adeninivorans TaxID=409370 RepID=A0A060T3K7_BLAAD